LFEIGSSLRQARQHRGLELSDVERDTRIRAKYLGALEEDRFDVLPGAAYVRGFMRTYAEYLGLDSNLLVDAYNERHAPPEDELPAIQHHPVGEAHLHVTRPAAVLLAALLAGTVVVWQLGFSSPQRAPIAPTAAGASVGQAAAAPRKAKAAARRHRAAPAELVVRATRGSCWVAVRLGSASGPVVYQRILTQGGTLKFGLKKKLWVRLGAPWNTDVTVRGKKQGGLPRQPVNLLAA
jgi:hypothetical protein